MKHEFLLLTFAGIFFAALLFLVVVIYKPTTSFVSQSTQQKAAETNDKSSTSLQDKIDWLSQKVDDLTQKQITDAADLRSFIATSSAVPKQAVGKTILDTAQTQGSTFTTGSQSYTPMGMYVNVHCSQSCVLYINFFTSSKNQGPSASATNTYGIFLDGSDQNIHTQSSYLAANAAVPVALTAGLTVSAGTHTIDIQAKTTGGTLESDSSALTVLAVAK